MAVYGFGKGQAARVDFDGAAVEHLADELDGEMIVRVNVPYDMEQDFNRDIVKRAVSGGHTVVYLTGSWSPDASCQ